MSIINKTATVQVDIDSLAVINDAYTFGFDIEYKEDPIIRHSIPIYLELFKKLNIRATFFLVGKDLENQHNIAVFKSIIESGHEIANHSFSHNGFDTMSKREKVSDIKRSHEIIHTKLGIACKGFKAPGYCLNGHLLRILTSLDYVYDASMISTILSPIMKMYYSIVLKRKIHSSNYGYLFHIMAPSIPYIPDIKRPWRTGNQPIVEIPVTTLPYLKLPIHFSFVNLFGVIMFRWFFRMSSLSGLNYLNFAFHAADLMPADILPKLFYSRPGLSKSYRSRIKNAKKIMKTITSEYNVQTSLEIARSFNDRIY